MKRHALREDGTATVEAVLVLPLFILMLGLLVDATNIFHGQTNVLRIVQDANRNMSIGRFTTDTEVEDYINAKLNSLNITSNVTNAVVDQSFVRTTVSVPAAQFQLFGFFSELVNLELEMSAVHLLESWDPDTFTTTAMMAP